MLEQFRDIMIIITAFILIGAALLFSIMMLLIFHKVSSTLNSVRGFAHDIRSVSSLVSGRFAKPLTGGAIFAAGMRKAISGISKRSQRKEKGHGKRK
ncbi:MAG: hypothetical protein JSW38_03890 [Dehalococcoidia bacterium]|nr:MAG: hypothetical protein JSV02_07260 [Dehalococcoidia bacterium]UCG83968.1 MAG: hypothetical protein JSW38_03890 [Dehalococcoidia bacterium]